MTDPFLPPVVVAALKAGVPKALQAFQQAQAERARDAIVKNLARGKYWAISEDRAAAAMWRYMRAAMEGAAKRNLELLAEALVNGAVDPEFAPDEFKRQADRLEGLSRSEIVALAALVQTIDLSPAEGEAAIVTRYRAATEWALRTGTFSHAEEVDACFAGLTRTGWVATAGGFGFSGYRATSELLNVARLVDFDAARQAES